MKKLLLILLCSFGFCWLGSSVQSGAEQNQNHPTKFNRVSALIGMEVRNPKNEKLAELKEIAVDLSAKRATYAVIASGGFLGMGDKLLAIPCSALKPSPEGNFLVLDADKEALRAAPSFNTGNWPNFAGIRSPARPQNFSEPFYAPGQEITEAAGAENKRARRIQSTGQWERAGSGQWEGDGDSSPAPEPPPPLEAVTPQTPNLSRASDLIGASVKTAEGQKVGDIRDIVLDLKTGKLLYAVLASGGFLGVNEKLLALPTDTLTYSEPKKVAMLNISASALRMAGGFDENNWPMTANQKLAAAQTENGFQEPSGGRSGRTGETETSQVKQSNEPEDIALAKKIKQALLAEKSLSRTAANVTVTTDSGRVYLSGNPGTSSAKSRIEKIARDIAGGENVTSFLETN